MEHSFFKLHSESLISKVPGKYHLNFLLLEQCEFLMCSIQAKSYQYLISHSWLKD